MNRQHLLQKLRNTPEWPVLIIGGGVNGISTFRDLALQDIPVLLVERADFCSGASAASSHMAHGGIRYLENGEFKLVREAVTERERLLANAPHYVKTLPTVIPIFKRFSGLLNAPFKFLRLLDKPAERGSLVIKLGLHLYDSFTGKQRYTPRHEFLSKTASLTEFPQLNPAIINTARYYDGLIRMPERLCLEMITDTLTATKTAVALNYVNVSGSRQGQVQLTDVLSGETMTVRPQIVINATGPWIDLANKQLGQQTHFIQGTKGSHIVVQHDELLAAIQGHEFFFENDDGRIVLICPLFDRVLIGTSDLFVEQPDDIICTPAEIDYFLDMIPRIFPDIKIERSHIVFTFSGVRPLPAAGTNSRQTGQISRDHTIQKHEGAGFPVLNLVGGKWTTHRAFAEQTTDQVLAFLGCPRKVSTALRPIGGGIAYAAVTENIPRWCRQAAADTGLPAAHIAELFNRYGTLAGKMAAAMSQMGEDSRLQANPAISVNELIYLVQHEQIQFIDDFLLRRSHWAILGKVTPQLVQECGRIIGSVLGWSPQTITAEVQKTMVKLRQQHGMKLPVMT